MKDPGHMFAKGICSKSAFRAVVGWTHVIIRMFLRRGHTPSHPCHRPRLLLSELRPCSWCVGGSLYFCPRSRQPTWETGWVPSFILEVGTRVLAANVELESRLPPPRRFHFLGGRPLRAQLSWWERASLSFPVANMHFRPSRGWGDAGMSASVVTLSTRAWPLPFLFSQILEGYFCRCKQLYMVVVSKNCRTMRETLVGQWTRGEPRAPAAWGQEETSRYWLLIQVLDSNLHQGHFQFLLSPWLVSVGIQRGWFYLLKIFVVFSFLSFHFCLNLSSLREASSN